MCMELGYITVHITRLYGTVLKHRNKATWTSVYRCWAYEVLQPKSLSCFRCFSTDMHQSQRQDWGHFLKIFTSSVGAARILLFRGLIVPISRTCDSQQCVWDMLPSISCGSVRGGSVCLACVVYERHTLVCSTCNIW